MVRLEYSQVVRKKLKNLRNELAQNYGEDNSKKIMSNITNGIRRLETFPQSIWDCNHFARNNRLLERVIVSI